MDTISIKYIIEDITIMLYPEFNYLVIYIWIIY